MKTIDDARAWMRGKMDGGGCKCPCCGQNVETKARHITSSMARDLLAMSRACDARGRVDIKAVKAVRGGDYAKLRFWGLIDAGDSQGMWVVTALGHNFVNMHARVPSTVHVYNNRVRSVSGDEVNFEMVTA